MPFSRRGWLAALLVARDWGYSVYKGEDKGEEGKGALPRSLERFHGNPQILLDERKAVKESIYKPPVILAPGSTQSEDEVIKGESSSPGSTRRENAEQKDLIPADAQDPH